MSEENLTDQGSTAEKTTTEAELEAQSVIEREVETSQEPAPKTEALDATGKGSTASDPRLHARRKLQEPKEREIAVLRTQLPVGRPLPPRYLVGRQRHRRTGSRQEIHAAGRNPLQGLAGAAHSLH